MIIRICLLRAAARFYCLPRAALPMIVEDGRWLSSDESEFSPQWQPSETMHSLFGWINLSKIYFDCSKIQFYSLLFCISWRIFWRVNIRINLIHNYCQCKAVLLARRENAWILQFYGCGATPQFRRVFYPSGFTISM